MNLLTAIVGYGWIIFCLLMFIVHAALSASRRDDRDARARSTHHDKGVLLEAVRRPRLDRYA